MRLRDRLPDRPEVTADDLRGMAARPIAQPVTLGSLAAQGVEDTMTKPWHGVLVATALPIDRRLAVDFDRFAEHVAWLAANGCHGVTPNGSLGEYPTLTPEERARVVPTAVEAAPDGFTVMPGVAAYGAAEARRWAEQAAEAGCPAVMALPPNAYRADERAVLAHYREVAKAGVPIVAYNNPIDTKVDLVPELLAELYQEGLIVGVKEFTGDVRRTYRIPSWRPAWTCCAAPTTWRSSWRSPARPAGSPGSPTRCRSPSWRSGGRRRPATSPRRCRCTGRCTRCCAGTPASSSCRPSSSAWTSPGRYGGPCRQPRVPLTPEHEAAVRQATERALAEGLT